MLKLREVPTFSPVIHDVVGDLLRRIEFLRSGSRDGVTVSDIASELYRFGFEGDNCLCSGNGRRDPGKFPKFFGHRFFWQGSQRSCLKRGWAAWKRRSIQRLSASSEASTTCCLCPTSPTSSPDGPAASSLCGAASSRPGTTSQTLVCSGRQRL